MTSINETLETRRDEIEVLMTDLGDILLVDRLVLRLPLGASIHWRRPKPDDETKIPESDDAD